ncbi:RDD family protein [Moraxella catarrhalis]|uniref:RDD family protein n=1 Tax=Moraxella catarrhalis TaxID=480 RepID=UPI000E0334B7|nr:RDD family protein [Moraxella catarrhalis]STY80687.1 RDD family [Moraxella catarrhalis]
MVTNTAVSHSPQYDDSEFEYAGFWIRFAALIVDDLIIMIISAPYWFYNYQQMTMPVDQIPFYSAGDAILSLVLGAAVIWFWVKKGATPGKMLFGLQIRDAKTGQFISVPRALLRYFSYLISSVILCLGLIWVGFDQKKQGWHDKIAKTVVVKRIR